MRVRPLPLILCVVTLAVGACSRQRGPSAEAPPPAAAKAAADYPTLVNSFMEAPF